MAVSLRETEQWGVGIRQRPDMTRQEEQTDWMFLIAVCRIGEVSSFYEIDVNLKSEVS